VKINKGEAIFGEKAFEIDLFLIVPITITAYNILLTFWLKKIHCFSLN
jgi:hypothetical protein